MAAVKVIETRIDCDRLPCGLGEGVLVRARGSRVGRGLPRLGRAFLARLAKKCAERCAVQHVLPSHTADAFCSVQDGGAILCLVHASEKNEAVPR